MAAKKKKVSVKVRSVAKRGVLARYPWKEEPNPYVELRTSKIQGTGAFAARDIKKGTRIIEYLGQRISWRTADKRYDGRLKRWAISWSRIPATTTDKNGAPIFCLKKTGSTSATPVAKGRIHRRTRRFCC